MNEFAPVRLTNHNLRLAKLPGPYDLCSQNGKKIAMVKSLVDSSHASADVWVMNADGNGQSRLTYLSGGVPAWSPNGKKIAFYSGRRAGNSEIYVMDVIGR